MIAPSKLAIGIASAIIAGVVILIALVVVYLTQTDAEASKIQTSPIVQTAQGKVQGQIRKDYYGQSYYSYRGIPYAKPPVIDLRFKSPQPPDKWKGVRKAITQPKPCPQIKSFVKAESSEDCLILNVYTTDLNASRPVMFYIHGGAFVIGAAIAGPEFLIHEEIVIVEIQYRLNIFGFMSLQDPSLDISENAGLKDQVQALKWVQENIHAFGGDKNQVTIAGESAGAAAVQLLYVSPLTKGLFHRAAAQSGSVSVPWLYGKKNRYFELARRVGCTSRVNTEILECLRQVSVESLMQEFQTIEANTTFGNGQLSSFNLIALEQPGPDAFLTESPEILLKEGRFEKLPYMTGYNSNEGVTFLQVNPVKPNFLDNELLIPSDLNVTLDTHESRTMGQDIQDFFYRNLTPSIELRQPFIDYLTDFMFVEKLYRHAKQVSDHAPVYFYEFAYKIERLNCVQITCQKGFVGHGEDLPYLFYFEGLTPNDIKAGSDEDIAIRRVVNLFTQFIKTGNPNALNDPLLQGVVWKPFTRNEKNYYYIDQNLKGLQNPEDRRMKFWEKIYKIE